MRREGIWAGHLELQAASVVLGANIAVYQEGQPIWTVKNHPEARTGSRRGGGGQLCQQRWCSVGAA